jgi:hypothetical protein
VPVIRFNMDRGPDPDTCLDDGLMDPSAVTDAE